MREQHPLISQADLGTIGNEHSTNRNPYLVVERIRRSFHPIRQNMEGVGIPNNNKWDLVAAHERRFCFDH